jgi:hypothetical protein
MMKTNFSTTSRIRAVIGLAGAALLLTALAAEANPVPPSSGLIGYWQGNGNANDSSSIGNNGTFPANTYSPGPPGYGIQSFNLAAGGVQIPNNAAYSAISSSTDFSIGFWFNFNGAPPGASDIIGQDVGPGGNPKWFIDYNYFNPGGFEFLTGPALQLVAGPVGAFPGWNQLTLTESGGLYQFYLNGVADGSGTIGAWGPVSFPLQFSFGDGGAPYAGLLADVVLYDRALSPAEVDTLVATTPLPAGLPLFAGAVGALGAVGRWRMSRRGKAAA